MSGPSTDLGVLGLSRKDSSRLGKCCGSCNWVELGELSKGEEKGGRGFLSFGKLSVWLPWGRLRWYVLPFLRLISLALLFVVVFSVV